MISETTEVQAIQGLTSEIALELPPQHRQPPKEATKAIHFPFLPFLRLLACIYGVASGQSIILLIWDLIFFSIRLGSLKFEKFCAHREPWPGLSIDSTPYLKAWTLVGNASYRVEEYQTTSNMWCAINIGQFCYQKLNHIMQGRMGSIYQYDLISFDYILYYIHYTWLLV